MIAQGIIRKISIGDIKEGITYKLGQPMFGDSLEISGIVQDVEYLNEHGIIKFDVYVKNKKYSREAGSTDASRIWKSFINVPISIEYELEVEKDETDK